MGDARPPLVRAPDPARGARAAVADRELELVTWCSGVASIAAGRRWSVYGRPRAAGWRSTASGSTSGPISGRRASSRSASTPRPRPAARSRRGSSSPRPVTPRRAPPSRSGERRRPPRPRQQRRLLAGARGRPRRRRGAAARRRAGLPRPGRPRRPARARRRPRRGRRHGGLLRRRRGARRRARRAQRRGLSAANGSVISSVRSRKRKTSAGRPPARPDGRRSPVGTITSRRSSTRRRFVAETSWPSAAT